MNLNLMMKISPSRRYNFRHFTKLCILIAGICCGPIFVGQVIGYSSPASLHLETTHLLSSSQLSWFASLVNIGGMIGSLIVGGLLDRIGRKWTLIVSAAPVLVGWFFIGWAKDHGDGAKLFLFYSGRILTGISVGMCMTATSVYLIEIAPTSLRGTIGSCNQLGITIGIFTVYLFGMILKDYVLLASFGSLFPFLLVLAMFFAPESPRWLVKTNMRLEAANSLAGLREPYYDVEEELRDIEESLLQETCNTKHKRSWKDFLQPELMVPLRIAGGLVVFQQLSGINVIMFYSSPIFKSAGYGLTDAYMPPIVVGLVQVLATIASVPIMDRFGRRQLLSVSSFFMFVALVWLTIFYAVGSKASWMALLCLNIYIIGFSIGWGPIPMLIAAEVFPTWARSTAGGISIFFMWMSSFLVTQSFPAVRAAIGPAGSFGLFAISLLVAVVFVQKYMPETKGKSLEEIQLFFASRVSKSAAAAARLEREVNWTADHYRLSCHLSRTTFAHECHLHPTTSL